MQPQCAQFACAKAILKRKVCLQVAWYFTLCPLQHVVALWHQTSDWVYSGGWQTCVCAGVGWRFDGSLVEGKTKPCGEWDTGEMWECPFFVELQTSAGTQLMDTSWSGLSCRQQKGSSCFGLHIEQRGTCSAPRCSRERSQFSDFTQHRCFHVQEMEPHSTCCVSRPIHITERTAPPIPAYTGSTSMMATDSM